MKTLTQTVLCARRLVAAGVVAGSLLAVTGYGQDQVQFRWAIVKSEGAGQPDTVLPANKLAMNSGDVFRVYVQSETKQFLYVLYQGAGEGLDWLYPPPAKPYAGSAAGEELFFPAKTQWFVLDQKKGREVFYVVASAVRPEALESALKDLAAKKADAQAKVLAEIRALARRYSDVAGAGKKPVPIAGSSRGPGAPSASNQEVARGFLNKIIDIEHR
jgi:hypothetical protein